MLKKIIWAIDAMEKNQALKRKTVQTLRHLTSGTNASIEPVYVLGPDRGSVYDIEPPKEQNDFKTLATKKLLTNLKSVRLRGMTAPTIVESKTPLTREVTRALISYAKQKKADLIVVSTHGRKGISRFFLGSFAETLVLQSRIPLLLISPKIAVKNKLSPILFPTDLGASSKDALKMVSEFAFSVGAKLIVFHQVEPIAAADPFTSPLSLSARLRSDNVDRREKEAKSIVDSLKTKRVQTHLVVVRRPNYPLDGILASAKKFKAGMIAIASQSSSLETVLTGSIARQVIREATCPVWIVRPALG